MAMLDVSLAEMPYTVAGHQPGQEELLIAFTPANHLDAHHHAPNRCCAAAAGDKKEVDLEEQVELFMRLQAEKESGGEEAWVLT